MTSTLSPKFQVVIPKEIRTLLKWKAGIKLFVSPGLDGTVQLVPVKTKNIKELRGFLKGKITPFVREKSDRKL